MRVSFVVDAAKLYADMNAVERRAVLGMRRAVQAAGHAARAKTYSEAPVDTGAYRDSIQLEFKNSGTFAIFDLYTDDWKGPRLEYGTVDGRGVHYSGKPHFELGAKEAERILEERINWWSKNV